MNRKAFLDSLIGLIMGAGIMLGAYNLIPKETILKLVPNTTAESIVFFFSVIICPFIAILIHELGHLTAGLVQNFKLQLFVVAFLGIKRHEDSIKVYLNREYQYFGGIAATSPQKITDKLKKQFALILIAGPLFSLIFGILFLILFVFTDTIFNASFGIIGIISIGLFFATTIPEKSGIFFTDRKRIQRLFDKGKTGEIEQSYIEITSQLLIDNHFKNLSLDKLKLIQSDNEPIVQFWGHYFEFKYYEEAGDLAKSSVIKTNLDSFQQMLPKQIWQSLSIS